VTDRVLGVGQSVLASKVISASDPEGDAMSYEVWDGGTNNTSGYFELNGTKLSAGSSHSLTQSEFDVLKIVGASQNSTETLWVRVSDGATSTAWKNFSLTTVDILELAVDDFSLEISNILDMGDLDDIGMILESLSSENDAAPADIAAVDIAVSSSAAPDTFSSVDAFADNYIAEIIEG